LEERHGFQPVEKIDDIEEPSPGSVADSGPEDADSQMGFPVPVLPNWHKFGKCLSSKDRPRPI
jgi:hypothetical protein